MTFFLLSQLEEIVLKFVVNGSSSSFTELEKLINDIFLDCYTINPGTLSNILSNLTKKQLIIKKKHSHIDSNQSMCKYIYLPTQSAKDLIKQYDLIHQTVNYSVNQYIKTKI